MLYEKMILLINFVSHLILNQNQHGYDPYRDAESVQVALKLKEAEILANIWKLIEFET